MNMEQNHHLGFNEIVLALEHHFRDWVTTWIRLIYRIPNTFKLSLHTSHGSGKSMCESSSKQSTVLVGSQWHKPTLNIWEYMQVAQSSQTVNLVSKDFDGANPSTPTITNVFIFFIK